MATVKHKFHKLLSNAANQKLDDFLEKHQKLAKKAFGTVVHTIIESIYAKMSPHLWKSINQAPLENGTFKQITKTPRKRIRAKWVGSSLRATKVVEE